VLAGAGDEAGSIDQLRRTAVEISSASIRPHTPFSRSCQRPRHHKGEPVALSKPGAIPSWSGPRDTPGALPPHAGPHSRHGY
jgi:hypothetical protein